MHIYCYRVSRLIYSNRSPLLPIIPSSIPFSPTLLYPCLLSFTLILSISSYWLPVYSHSDYQSMINHTGYKLPFQTKRCYHVTHLLRIKSKLLSNEYRVILASPFFNSFILIEIIPKYATSLVALNNIFFLNSHIIYIHIFFFLLMTSLCKYLVVEYLK